MKYDQIIIKSKADWPKVKGTYFCNRSGFDTVMELDPDLPEKSYMREIRWYLQPVKVEEKTADELDLIQYVTNLLYFAHTDGNMSNAEFDEWVEEQTNNLDQYFHSHQVSQEARPTDEEKAKSIGDCKYYLPQSNECTHPSIPCNTCVGMGCGYYSYCASIPKSEPKDELKLGMKVYHSGIYKGKEKMEIIGIRKNEVELQGDYSGGTHNVCQSDWLPIEGLILPTEKDCQIPKK
jgi:hypothetical protein